MIAKVIIFIFGSIIGSFLNVCIYRMPLGKSVVWPGSHCPLCEKRIPWYDNIPFLSYLLLKGRCRFCQGVISPKYLIVELLTAILFVVLYSYYGLTYDFFFYVVFIGGLIIASFVDLKHRIIPDEVSLGGIVLGFILSSIRGVNLQPLIYNFRPMVNSFLGIIIGAGIIYLSGFLFDLVYFKMLKKGPIDGETESMGGGDVKLLAMIGAFLGWQKVILTFFLAPFFGAAIGIINLIIRRQHTIAYGPFLSLAALISLLWADRIIALVVLR
jgi:leader peptidase (prepilin peptidase)/N-methyltransferase